MDLSHLMLHRVLMQQFLGEVQTSNLQITEIIQLEFLAILQEKFLKFTYMD